MRPLSVFSVSNAKQTPQSCYELNKTCTVLSAYLSDVPGKASGFVLPDKTAKGGRVVRAGEYGLADRSNFDIQDHFSAPRISVPKGVRTKEEWYSFSNIAWGISAAGTRKIDLEGDFG